MVYKNKRTGAIISISSELKGEEWTRLFSPKTEGKADTKAAKKGTGKK